MNTATEASKFSIPTLSAGEIYAGAIITPTGEGHHVIILPGDNDDADWNAAMEWAKSIGGDLPDRVEQALFYKHQSEQFKQDWYWSNTQHAVYSYYVWNQFFFDGDQRDFSKSFECRARAVRRVSI